MAIKRKNKKRKAITILLILIFIICNFSFTVINSEGVTVNEIIGSDKYDTSIKVSRELCKISKINTIVLVNENSVAEGLIATPLANIENASILLTEKDKLINVTKDELKRVAPKKIIIIGGENSISDNVVSQIKGELPSVTIERLGGENRYETSLKIAQAIDAKQDIKNIYVGCSEVDLLSIASKAGEEKQPIILSKEDGLDKEAYKWLKEEELENAYIIGRKDTLIEKLDGDYRFGLVKFDGDTTILNNLTDNKIDLYETLDNIKSIALGNNGTNITKAIEISSELFNKSDDRRKVIILLADGADNKSSESEIIKSAQDIYSKYNVQIYTVGLGKAINSNILEKIAESTNGKYFSADKAENLLKEFMNISSNIQKEDVKLIASNEFNINDQLPYANFRHPKYGGQCYGMALTSILNYQNRLPKQVALDKNHYEKEYNLPTKDYIITSNPKDKNIRDCINWWWNSQTMKISNLNKINNIDDIKNKIDKEPLLISFKGNGIGHAVVGQKLYQNSRYENEYYIEVYDSNYPKENRYIKVVEEYTLDGKVNLNLDALDYKFDNGLNLFYTTDVDKVYKYLEKNYYF